jgi:hypothetical protein
MIRARIKGSPLKTCYCPWFKNFNEHLARSKVTACTEAQWRALKCGAVGAFPQTPDVWCYRCRKTAASNNQSGSSDTHSTQQSNASKQHCVQQGAKQAKQQG